MDYGKYKYELTQKKKEAKKKQVTFQVKEIKLRPKTGDHDLNVKIGHIKKFLGRKDKVKVSVIFRGREIMLSDRGKELLEQITEKTAELSIVEQTPKLEGRAMVMVLGPK
jgi:translation initiation factor IF-3